MRLFLAQDVFHNALIHIRRARVRSARALTGSATLISPFFSLSPHLKELKNASTGLELRMKLRIDYPPTAHRATHIIATIGPKTQTVDALHELFKVGVDVVRMNFSHGSHEVQHAQTSPRHASLIDLVYDCECVRVCSFTPRLLSMHARLQHALDAPLPLRWTPRVLKSALDATKAQLRFVFEIIKSSEIVVFTPCVVHGCVA